MDTSEKIVWAFLILVLLLIIAVIAIAGSAISDIATLGALILDVFYMAGGPT